MAKWDAHLFDMVVFEFQNSFFILKPILNKFVEILFQLYSLKETFYLGELFLRLILLLLLYGATQIIYDIFLLSCLVSLWTLLVFHHIQILLWFLVRIRFNSCKLSRARLTEILLWRWLLSGFSDHVGRWKLFPDLLIIINNCIWVALNILLGGCSTPHWAMASIHSRPLIFFKLHHLLDQIKFFLHFLGLSLEHGCDFLISTRNIMIMKNELTWLMLSYSFWI